MSCEEVQDACAMCAAALSESHEQAHEIVKITPGAADLGVVVIAHSPCPDHPYHFAVCDGLGDRAKLIALLEAVLESVRVGRTRTVGGAS